MTTKAFDGVKVADFSWYALGPLNTKFLGDHGATVVRIESSTRIDLLRMIGPFKDGAFNVNCSGWYNHANTSKYGMTLDVTKPKGLEVAKKLAGWADIVVENYTPGTLQKWGLGYDELQKIKPDIIMVSASNQGQYGPYAYTPAFGYIATAMSGIHHLTGWPDREPAGPAGPFTDFLVPPLITTVLIAALDYRRRIGKGQVSQDAAADGVGLGQVLQFVCPSRRRFRQPLKLGDGVIHQFASVLVSMRQVMQEPQVRDRDRSVLAQTRENGHALQQLVVVPYGTRQQVSLFVALPQRQQGLG